MAATTTLESLAELLPPENRERFFTITNRFRALEEDDEHLQLLEAIGFVMLVMDQIPSKIAGILEQSKLKLGEPETAQLQSEIVTVLADSLDTPSYKDLREAMLAMRSYEARFRQKVDGLHKRLAAADGAMKKVCTVAPFFWGGLTAGLTIAIVAAAFAMFGLPVVTHQEPLFLPEKLRPYAELLERGNLDYFEMDLSESSERVGMFLIGGGVKEAFKDGEHGVVVLPLR